MNTLVLITIIMVLSIILIKLDNKENFKNFNEILASSQNESNIKKKDILNNSIQILSKGNIPII